MGGAGWFFLILFLIVLVYAGWIGWKFYNARKTGEKLNGWKAFVPFMKSGGGSSTNYPTPRSLGPVEWVKDQITKFRSRNNRSTTRAGYEDTRGGEGAYQNLNPGGPSGARGRGRGMEDDAWDSRVGNEDPYGPGPGGYYEEAELGLAPTPGVGGGAAGAHQPYNTDYIGQNTSYGGHERNRSGASDLNPFGDQHEASSMRSVSPRPQAPPALDTSRPMHSRGFSDEGNTSPISTRKSIFREEMS